MPEWFHFVLASFACFRIAELIAVDDGPGDVLLWIRAKLGAYDLGEDGRPETSIARAVICPYCIGIWLAFFLAFAVMPAPIDWRLLLWWLAIAGGQALLQRIGGRI